MENKFITEAEMCRRDPWLPEALMCVAYFMDVQAEQLSKSMNIDIAHAEKLIELLEEYGFVKTENGKKKLTFTQQEYLEKYSCSLQVLESLFGKQIKTIDELAEIDALLPDALRLAVEQKNIAITMMMRQFGIGYPRAAKIVDYMEEKGYISPSNEKNERTVYVKTEDFEDLSKFSGKPQKRESFFTDDQKTMLKEHQKDFNLDEIQFLDENGKILNAEKCKHIKDIMLEQFCGIGIICMEIQDAEIILKKNNNVMHCKTFENPTAENLQAFVDSNKIDSAIVLYEVNSSTSVMSIYSLFPKIELAYFAVCTPLPTIKDVTVNILY